MQFSLEAPPWLVPQEKFSELLVQDCQKMLLSNIFMWNSNNTKFYKSRILHIAWQRHTIFPRMIIGNNIIICVIFRLNIKILVNRHRYEFNYSRFLFLNRVKMRPSCIFCTWFWHNELLQIKDITSNFDKIT